jgi:CelD/BcsL family acetyltransferase involved in cellulose biosynthesis
LLEAAGAGGRAFPGAHFESTDPELARQLQRKRAWLERRDGYAFQRTEDPSALRHWERLHTLRWEQEGGSGAVDGPATLEFHRDVSQRLAARGRLRLYLLEAEGAVVACIYGFEHGTKAYFYQCGYDPAWAKRSVGSILLGMVVEETHRRGLLELDLLRGSESYKFRFAKGRRQTLRLEQSLTLRGDAALTWDGAYTRLRGWVKQALPEPWRKPISQALHRWRTREARP